MSVDALCACGHPLHHAHKPCAHPVDNDLSRMCPCQGGKRLEVAALEVALETQMTLTRILAVMETAAGLQSRVVRSGNGGMHVEVKPRPNQSKLIVPG